TTRRSPRSLAADLLNPFRNGLSARGSTGRAASGAPRPGDSRTRYLIAGERVGLRSTDRSWNRGGATCVRECRGAAMAEMTLGAKPAEVDRSWPSRVRFVIGKLEWVVGAALVAM